mmetsp:Transcript_24984/g.55422  ORF Transcript_24984/g.55422 Transcript_24984/m.55422 type:complete len:227 (-) Transcript_24984:316-996(-)
MKLRLPSSLELHVLDCSFHLLVEMLDVVNVNRHLARGELVSHKRIVLGVEPCQLLSHDCDALPDSLLLQLSGGKGIVSLRLQALILDGVLRRVRDVSREDHDAWDLHLGQVPRLVAEVVHRWHCLLKHPVGLFAVDWDCTAPSGQCSLPQAHQLRGLLLGHIHQPGAVQDDRGQGPVVCSHDHRVLILIHVDGSDCSRARIRHTERDVAAWIVEGYYPHASIGKTK